MRKKCKGCEHFHILYEPYKCGHILWDTGMVKCEKHNLVADYASKQKLDRLECIEEKDR